MEAGAGDRKGRTMSDEKGATRHKGADLYVHYCERPECKEWGSSAMEVPCEARAAGAQQKPSC